MATSPNIYRCNARQLATAIDTIWAAGLVPNIISSPGIGKSTILRKRAKAFNLKLIDHRISTSQPEDLTGLPEFITAPWGQRVASFTPFDLFPTEDTPIPEGYDGWCIFFDEFNSGTIETQAACYKIILDKMVGQRRLHPKVVMACAGNLMTDRAITQDLSTAMQSRLVHLELEFNQQIWLEDVCALEDYDERIIGYNRFEPDATMDFRPDHNDKTFCCPRTWEFMDRIIKVDPEVNAEKTFLYAGTITSTHAAGFVSFCEVAKELITVEDVLRNPDAAPVPEYNEVERKWVITSHLMKRANEETFGDIAKYMGRYDITYRVLFFRGVLAKFPELRRHPAYSGQMLEIQRYLGN